MHAIRNPDGNATVTCVGEVRLRVFAQRFPEAQKQDVKLMSMHRITGHFLTLLGERGAVLPEEIRS